MTFQQLEYIVRSPNAAPSTRRPRSCSCPSRGFPRRCGSLRTNWAFGCWPAATGAWSSRRRARSFSATPSLLEQKRGIESLYGEARNAAAPVRFSVSCQRYPFAVDAFLRSPESPVKTASDLASGRQGWTV